MADDEQNATDPSAPRAGFDHLGRRIVGEIRNEAPTADEIWAAHVQRNWDRRHLDSHKERPPRRSRRRI